MFSVSLSLLESLHQHPAGFADISEAQEALASGAHALLQAVPLLARGQEQWSFMVASAINILDWYLLEPMRTSLRAARDSAQRYAAIQFTGILAGGPVMGPESWQLELEARHVAAVMPQALPALEAALRCADIMTNSLKRVLLLAGLVLRNTTCPASSAACLLLRTALKRLTTLCEGPSDAHQARLPQDCLYEVSCMLARIALQAECQQHLRGAMLQLLPCLLEFSAVQLSKAAAGQSQAQLQKRDLFAVSVLSTCNKLLRTRLPKCCGMRLADGRFGFELPARTQRHPHVTVALLRGGCLSLLGATLNRMLEIQPTPEHWTDLSCWLMPVLLACVSSCPEAAAVMREAAGLPADAGTAEVLEWIGAGGAEVPWQELLRRIEALPELTVAADVVAPADLEGLRLEALPGCCNPRCTNLKGTLSEGSLQLKACGGCKVARYCNRLSQQSAWAKHKPACKAFCMGTDQ
ncbi:hypothetical protein WJX81_002461 [Elliptochloris bilobata]|uniref:MYND-type domain-containing protein n=1 Tax=Elliptochloris bilobata TaxID=381761 RepID=A0AAW1RIU3_9CHLO